LFLYSKTDKTVIVPIKAVMDVTAREIIWRCLRRNRAESTAYLSAASYLVARLKRIAVIDGIV
jgi:hypothetical protein